MKNFDGCRMWKQAVAVFSQQMNDSGRYSENFCNLLQSKDSVAQCKILPNFSESVLVRKKNDNLTNVT
jgi:hypothetical protein